MKMGLTGCPKMSAVQQCYHRRGNISNLWPIHYNEMVQNAHLQYSIPHQWKTV